MEIGENVNGKKKNVLQFADLQQLGRNLLETKLTWLAEVKQLEVYWEYSKEINILYSLLLGKYQNIIIKSLWGHFQYISK